MKFRKKPVEIEAFQMTVARRLSNDEWPAWLHRAWNSGNVFPQDWPKSDGTDQLVINTMEGQMVVSFGDWIIRGIHGELYPCKPDIFEKTYERAD